MLENRLTVIKFFSTVLTPSRHFCNWHYSEKNAFYILRIGWRLTAYDWLRADGLQMADGWRLTIGWRLTVNMQNCVTASLRHFTVSLRHFIASLRHFIASLRHFTASLRHFTASLQNRWRPIGWRLTADGLHLADGWRVIPGWRSPAPFA